MDDLYVKSAFGEELPINSSEENFCLRCGVTIDSKNDSGWEKFRADGVTTQGICKSCDIEDNKICLKQE